MPIYNKLVRDRIPEIIENNGKTFTTRILDKKEYIEEKPNGGNLHANLQQTNQKQNPPNNKKQQKNTHNKNPTPR